MLSAEQEVRINILKGGTRSFDSSPKWKVHSFGGDFGRVKIETSPMGHREQKNNLVSLSLSKKSFDIDTGTNQYPSHLHLID